MADWRVFQPFRLPRFWLSGLQLDALPLGYIPAIDGLRAVAVLSVIIFHLGVGWLPGGFVGVDVFFIISGFVVAASVKAVRFDGIGQFFSFFYARRIRRIVPALVCCVLVTALFSALLIPVVFLSQTNERTGIAALVGLSNLYLIFIGNDYFSPSVELNPFTHTWSLAVEEQFYILFPLLWFACVSRKNTDGRGRVFSYFCVLSLLSIILCIILTYWYRVAAFYLIFSRFWELGAGVLLAVTVVAWSGVIRRLPTWGSDAGAMVAFLALAAAFLFADEARFPFPWALLPVTATAALICFVTARPDCGVARALSWRPVVYVGRTSYSLYLWHWPVFVLLKWTVGLDTAASQLSGLAMTVLFALTTYHLVEQPFRRSVRLSGRSGMVVAGGALGLIAAIAVTFGINQSKSWLSLSETRRADIWLPIKALDTANGCGVQSEQEAFARGERLLMTADCAKGVSRRVIYVLGDSHAIAYRPLLAAVVANSGDEVAIYRKSGCPFFRMTIANADASVACARFAAAAVEDVTSRAKSGDVVFLPSLRVPRFAEEWRGSANASSKSEPREPLSSRAVAEAEKTFAPLVARGVRIVVEAPKPLFKAAPFRCSDWFNASNPACRPGFDLGRAEFEQRALPAREAIDKLVEAVPAIVVWNPSAVLCPRDVCSAFSDGRPLFFDGDHLSRYGNAVLLPSFEAMLATL
ncbi:acyltransferase [Starkeya koreensis]|uniref:Acyltransferase n=1 Tax=Ancylobacter koreensis TaxID=266121 RepID=A0ABT0DNI1_9HYPH|nr:acyltransferase family protein [Ancylobacter koreensis]MCK0208831.1 acyltransferase [Ancylobacter koreensis]